MAKKEIIQVNLAAANPNLSPATRFGNLVFVAGQTGRHPITGEVGRDVREQTRYAIERIKMILETAATSLDNVLTVLTHLTKREDLAAYNEEYAKFFPTNKPARTTVEAMLNFPELLVEITVTACIPDYKIGIRHGATVRNRSKSTMSVRHLLCFGFIFRYSGEKFCRLRKLRRPTTSESAPASVRRDIGSERRCWGRSKERVPFTFLLYCVD